MAYTLNSIMTRGKYAGKTIRQCIDQHYYAFSHFIDKNPDWYDLDVLIYLSEISASLNNNLKKEY